MPCYAFLKQQLRLWTDPGVGPSHHDVGQITAKSAVDALEARRDLGPQAYADHALRWVDQGASIVGGCCETRPAHIAELARRLDPETTDRQPG
ncbi:MAG: hypothetical protein EA417_19365 [Gammaproteobacteria bacterium]|nr:MAG: hypothetical protein EA417_19365 [Gammaproteobacteria bacterium]